MNHVSFSMSVAALALVGLAQSHAQANLLANPGFENPITFDGPPFVGLWEGFSGGPAAQAANDNAMPRSGLQHLRLSIFNADNTFAGVFQDVPNLTPGDTAIFSGWHMTTTNPLDLDAEIRIEWRNSIANIEVGRTPNLIPTLTGVYELFTLATTVPAGADTARVVYAIQTFSGGPTNNGTVFVDDLSYVPAPGTLALALGGLGLAGLRRRRA